ncbi:hypothetical protein CYY_006874 [Polysphondylium violaceum]|uniref:FAM86 N-terminal domain-containing protein n=1 Tax=Polysphondylium violaceum TaxID=133409 RepID=A0A8J4PQN0_9MYCE|nr:hypothetical protein CYY_006874 [Polysphondylium violaceum]
MSNTSNQEQDDFIFRLKVLYNQMVHIPIMLATLRKEFPKFFNQNDDADTDLIQDLKSIPLQEKINNNILNHSNRPTTSYFKKFIKTIVDQLQKLDQEVHEEILEKFMKSLSTPTGLAGDPLCIKSYCLQDSKKEEWVTLVNENAYNLVGMTTWGAAYLLSDYILANKSFFSDKHILELGSGTGLAGIALQCVADPPCKKVVLTDYSPKVLNNLKENIELNNIEIQDFINTEDFQGESEKRFSVRILDWEIEDLKCLDQCLDIVDSEIIIGADIVYDPSLARYLVAILNYLLNKKAGSMAIISSTIRNQSTFEIFQKELVEKNLIVQDITNQCDLLNPSPFIYDRSQIVLYKIYANIQ